MSVKRLQKQLVRDLKASPRKAAVLGLLVLVALYFWSPLLIGRRKPTEEPIHAAHNGDSSTPAAATAPPAAEVTAQAAVGWRELATMIAGDVRMLPAELTTWSEAPLGNLEEPIESDEKPTLQETPDEPTPAITPAGLGLELTGTVVGGRRRVAIVNGHPYAEGRWIELPGHIVFQVVEVGHKRAVLEREGERFELEVEALVSAGDLAGDVVPQQ